MKKMLLLAGLIMSLSASFQSQAQVNINVQLGAPVIQQPWYANDNDYYYMPEQGVYYNVRRKVYVYPDGGRWLTGNRLPTRYGNYSYRSSHYVRVCDRNPFDRDNDYRQRYNGRGGNGNQGNNPHNDGRHDNGNHGGDRGRGDNGNYGGDRGRGDNGHGRR